ncbi:hypothetical protein L596_023337 [Steinernema carpocapsae]|uniref:Uncharacterized protein n=1 Tax=Steinernema carpocapsae TaxID=34508 RepID=A0A4U5MDA9_STECR|nr:hypothetical protein L596_023337 [Steinernema carpocapsae]
MTLTKNEEARTTLFEAAIEPCDIREAPPPREGGTDYARRNKRRTCPATMTTHGIYPPPPSTPNTRTSSRFGHLEKKATSRFGADLGKADAKRRKTKTLELGRWTRWSSWSLRIVPGT